MTQEQFNKLPKYVQSHIQVLENKIERLENEPLRIERLYGGEEVPAPKMTCLLYDNKMSELSLGDFPTVRVRPDPTNPRSHITVRVNSRGVTEIYSSESGSFSIHPVSGNFIEVTP